MTEPTPPPAAPPADPALERRASVGLALIGVGVLGILWGVVHVLGNQPTPEQLDFAHRVTDYQAREAVHESYPGGLLRAVIGLGIAMVGGRIRGDALRKLGRGD